MLHVPARMVLNACPWHQVYGYLPQTPIRVKNKHLRHAAVNTMMPVAYFMIFEPPRLGI